MTAPELTIRLVPRRRLIGLAFGAMHSARRGTGSDVAGSRPYRPGDDVDAIDWAATAKLSSAHGADEFVVRERYAEQAPRVVAVCDRRPSMALFPAPLPWLSKPDAVRAAVDVIAASAIRARGFIGYLDYAGGAPFWHRPQSERGFRELVDDHLSESTFDAPSDNLAVALSHLVLFRRDVPPGSFVFVVSDFLAPPPAEAWTDALERGWDVVPVVVQDPTWEQSFPEVGRLLVPMADPATGRLRAVRLRDAEAEERRQAHERRLARTLEDFRRLGLEPVVVSASAPEAVFRSFLDWATERQFSRAPTW